mmetsp:Transcript_30863/g.48114  ORF Transcript_30863/g.48114 Transcript_30863/m.48114 type:complete len:88 (-) Transcript_30863:3-266(-)
MRLGECVIHISNNQFQKVLQKASFVLCLQAYRFGVQDMLRSEARKPVQAVMAFDKVDNQANGRCSDDRISQFVLVRREKVEAETDDI